MFVLKSFEIVFIVSCGNVVQDVYIVFSFVDTVHLLCNFTYLFCYIMYMVCSNLQSNITNLLLS